MQKAQEKHIETWATFTLHKENILPGTRCFLLDKDGCASTHNMWVCNITQPDKVQQQSTLKHAKHTSL